jgi:hypothetical protein
MKLIPARLRLQALDRPVYVRDIEFQIGNGRESRIVRRVLLPGEASEPITVPSSGGPVRQLTIHIQPDKEGAGRLVVLAPGMTTDAVPNAEILLPAEMTQIARHIAQPGIDRHAIVLGPSKGRFSHLAIRVSEGVVGLQGLKIVYAGGITQMVPVGRQFRAGEQFPPFVLERDLSINEIQLLLADPLTTRAVFDVFGQYAEGWTGETGENRTYSAGWVMLGVRRPFREGMAAEDVNVPAGIGRFKKLRFTARDGAMTLGVITVLYEDGERSSLEVGQMLQRDQTSQPVTIEVSGRGRAISAIALPPGGKHAARRDGYVEVWGQN